jgi:hypothetical protein
VFLSQEMMTYYQIWSRDLDSLTVEEQITLFIISREPLLKDCTVNLLVLTSLNRFIFILKILFTYITKQVTLMTKSTIRSLPLQLVFPVILF